MVKSGVVFECNNCGAQYPKWQGQCGECGKWNTLEEQVVGASAGSSKKKVKEAELISVDKVSKKDLARVKSGIGELDRVLGGGMVKGEVVLMVGEPGIGKSTLLTQLSVEAGDVVYVCGEESPSQVAGRVARLGKKAKGGLKLMSEVDVDSIVSALSQNNPSLVIVDSLQTLNTADLSGVAGSVSQIKECTQRLIRYAKKNDTPVFLVGHVTKGGEIAGPKILEHMVDAVLDLSGDRYHDLRLLRTVKNRFGATDEVGVFRMSGTGMEEVSNPSEIFLEERDETGAGSAVAVIMEGTRPVLVEIQALVVNSELPVPRRVAEGVSVRRTQLIIGVLQKHAGLRLSNSDVFVKVTGGVDVKEPAVDLAVSMAIVSSYYGKALAKNSVCVGEVGLLGEIRSVSWYDKRVKEASKLGYREIYSRDKYRKIADLVKRVKK